MWCLVYVVMLLVDVYLDCDYIVVSCCVWCDNLVV